MALPSALVVVNFNLRLLLLCIVYPYLDFIQVLTVSYVDLFSGLLVIYLTEGLLCTLIIPIT